MLHKSIICMVFQRYVFAKYYILVCQGVGLRYHAYAHYGLATRIAGLICFSYCFFICDAVYTHTYHNRLKQTPLLFSAIDSLLGLVLRCKINFAYNISVVILFWCGNLESPVVMIKDKPNLITITFNCGFFLSMIIKLPSIVLTGFHHFAVNLLGGRS